ncbi:hypothetical protein GQR58_019090 [Nymphon striatum]|nr:hypothetical protein GQR58_019090 [Nymphon striatum]
MVKRSKVVMKAGVVGDNVAVPIPSVDRGRGDPRNIIGVIVEVSDSEQYSIACPAGVLNGKHWISKNSSCGDVSPKCFVLPLHLTEPVYYLDRLKPVTLPNGSKLIRIKNVNLLRTRIKLKRIKRCHTTKCNPPNGSNAKRLKVERLKPLNNVNQLLDEHAKDSKDYNTSTNDSFLVHKTCLVYWSRLVYQVYSVVGQHGLLLLLMHTYTKMLL